jgi:amino acid transporter
VLRIAAAGSRRLTNNNTYGLAEICWSLGDFTLNTNEPAQSLEQDADQLRALGYESHFDRTMSKWENFSLGFTYLSPVVGVYTIFAIAFVAGGPPMWWTYIAVGLGQLMVCLIFGEIVSQFPIYGGLYPWARRLVGKRWAWMAGWVYAWALCCTMAGVATGAAPFLAQLFALESTPAATTTIALVLIGLTTALNLGGTRLLARVAMFGFICELVGAIVVGGYLLLFARHQPLKVLLDTSFVPVNGSYWPAFLASSLAAMFCYYGFEACGDVAEETPNASRMSPRSHVPATALVTMGAIPAMIALCALWLPDAIAIIITAAAIGIYVAFQMIVLAALSARGKGWRPAGPFTLGAWGWTVNLIALAYGIGAIVNMSWPRSPDDPWYVNYAMILTTLAVLVLGLIYMVLARPYAHGNAPAGDAHRVAAAGA